MPRAEVIATQHTVARGGSGSSAAAKRTAKPKQEKPKPEETEGRRPTIVVRGTAEICFFKKFLEANGSPVPVPGNGGGGGGALDRQVEPQANILNGIPLDGQRLGAV